MANIKKSIVLLLAISLAKLDASASECQNMVTSKSFCNSDCTKSVRCVNEAVVTVSNCAGDKQYCYTFPGGQEPVCSDINQCNPVAFTDSSSVATSSSTSASTSASTTPTTTRTTTTPTTTRTTTTPTTTRTTTTPTTTRTTTTPTTTRTTTTPTTTRTTTTPTTTRSTTTPTTTRTTTTPTTTRSTTTPTTTRPSTTLSTTTSRLTTTPGAGASFSPSIVLISTVLMYLLCHCVSSLWF